MAQESLNPFEIAQKQFDTAAEKIGLDDGMREVLRNPKRQLIVSIPTLMDDGSVRVFENPHALDVPPRSISKTPLWIGLALTLIGCAWTAAVGLLDRFRQPRYS